MNKSKKLLIATIVGISCAVICPSKTKAALQSNGGTPASYNINSWITGIRQMQATGQALGLTDEVDSTNLTSTNTNLDVHMQKNTEYGAMVLLSASAYGKAEKINNGETTTGNKTGVVMNINGEWTASGTAGTVVASMKSANGRYKNVYETGYTEKIGDGVATTGAWHGASGNIWFHINFPAQHSGWANECGIVRGYSGSIFSYYGYGFDCYRDGFKRCIGDHHALSGRYNIGHTSRAVVVVGSGI